ncbi:penicillin-binding transpeptidase domain-containing protein [Paenarthrobacter sp. Z7-10]|uniref:penicillin-binding transpeptidase domain-containing protein n=1 Tax=Paenarthrobacter sp. Z7-10 TaxID=2787635 RepID=UPI002E76AEB8|nr:penicillin-binding transpeptidase domain-containing protein [Paenarthrobacter sp. Z7-10]
MGKIQKSAAGLVLFLLAASLSGCDDGKAGARQAAAELASGLSALQMNSVTFSGGDAAAATSDLKVITKALQPIKPVVSVSAVDVHGDTATASLKVSWNLSAAPWTYATTAAMAKKDGTWSVAWTPQLLVPGLRDGEKLAETATVPRRADILGDGGKVLMTQLPVIRVGIDKTHVKAAAQAVSAKALAALVGLDPDAYASQVASAGASAFVEALVIRDDVSRSVTDSEISAIPGALGIKDSLPLAPTRSFARPVLGTVGPATAELIAKSGGKLQSGQMTGLSGLSQQYDQQLRGTPGVQITKVSADPAAAADAAASASETLFEVSPKPGAALKTSLNMNLQKLAESILKDEMGPAAIVAIRPSTGGVLAAASSPGSNGYNTALMGQYAPGSTFKVATSLALLRHGETPDSIKKCTPTVTVDGKSFKNANSYPPEHLGQIPLREAFAHSCNTAFISSAAVASQSDLSSAAASLGLGVDPQLGAPAFFGSVPSSAGGTDHAASMIGQGKVLVSPLAIATVAASVAHGSRVSPRLVLPTVGVSEGSTDSGTPTDGSTAAAAASAAAQDVPPLTKAETAALREMMRGVVTSGHAGRASWLTFPGPR